MFSPRQPSEQRAQPVVHDENAALPLTFSTIQFHSELKVGLVRRQFHAAPRKTKMPPLASRGVFPIYSAWPIFHQCLRPLPLFTRWVSLPIAFFASARFSRGRGSAGRLYIARS